MSDQPLLKKVKKLSKALTLLQRRTFFVDITVDSKFAALKTIVAENVDLQGRTVKVGFHVGDYNLSYFIFGQNPDKPEEAGEIDFDETYIDAALEQVIVEVKKLIATNILNDAVQKKLEEFGLN